MRSQNHMKNTNGKYAHSLDTSWTTLWLAKDIVNRKTFDVDQSIQAYYGDNQIAPYVFQEHIRTQISKNLVRDSFFLVQARPVVGGSVK